MVVCQHDGTLLMQVKKDEFIGSLLQEKYLVLSEIGRGGMSIVYKAKQEEMDRLVAIKMLQAGLMGDQTSIKRFRQEAQAASCLQHKNVITMYNYGISNSGQPFIVMDYLEGHSLSDVIKRENHLSSLRSANIFIQACDALAHAHQKGVLHRDLKCSNIMLIEHDGQPDFVKVVDFGIAKLMPNSGKQVQNLTQTGEVFGSPIYMSPEQCMGLPLDPRSDIYSMGTMLYEALTGQPPLLGANIIDTMQMHVETVPSLPTLIRADLQISKALEAVCMRALAKKPDDRFGSMNEFRDVLQGIYPTLQEESIRPQIRTGTKQNLPTAGKLGLTSHAPNADPGARAGGAGAVMKTTGANSSRDFMQATGGNGPRDFMKPAFQEPAAMNTNPAPHAVPPTLPQIPSRRVNSDYSDLLAEPAPAKKQNTTQNQKLQSTTGSVKKPTGGQISTTGTVKKPTSSQIITSEVKKSGSHQGSTQELKRGQKATQGSAVTKPDVFTPPTKRSTTNGGLIIMVVLISIAVILIIAVVALNFLSVAGFK